MKKRVLNGEDGSCAHRFALVLGVIGVLLAGLWLSSLTRTTAAQLPPLPPVPTATLTPMPKPTSPPPTGGYIELQAQFPRTWPWAEIHWQELWTAVQWQDEKGRWQDVDGWQGTLHDVAIGGDGSVVGYNKWWVARSDAGKGPFRWVVYRSQGGAVLATSEPFTLPKSAGETEIIEVSLDL